MGFNSGFKGLNSVHHASTIGDNKFLKLSHLWNYKTHRGRGGSRSRIGFVVSSPRNGKDNVFQCYRFIW